jgi:hypothetical protein
MSTIYIVELEPIESRYTGEWKTHVPQIIKEEITKRNLDTKLVVISGTNKIPKATTPGAFINFGGTNMYKSSQAMAIAEMFTLGKIQPGDKFLYTDAWNPTILQIKYMSQLLQIPVEIHALWHAGSYDPNDFLGRLMSNEKWVKSTEEALAYAIDKNYFATSYHWNIFPHVAPEQTQIVGWPMEYLKDTIYEVDKVEDIILFPHRISVEKQPELFRELAKRNPQYKWIMCQEENLTKAEYHDLLSRAKIVFSANLQETLGISCYEGALAGALPLVPDRLSYSEMYTDAFMYPDNATIEEIESIIHNMMSTYATYHKYALPTLLKKLDPFFSSQELVNNLLENENTF